MARLSTLDFCVLAVWSLVLSCSTAEREYFPQNATKSWVEARKLCQLCFKELVTLTPSNIQDIAMDLTREHWIGLRKRPLNASDNSNLYPYNDTTTFWSRWANEDPLAFQNWYPGYPVFKSPYPRKDCCSCSCTCPAKPTTGPTTPYPATTGISGMRKFAFGNTTTNSTSQWSTHSVTNSSGGATVSIPNSTTNSTSQWSTPSVTNSSGGATVSILNSTTNSTSQWSNHSALSRRATTFSTAAPLFESECVKKPMLFKDVHDPDENYIEDPCVAMLSFGTWVEKECSELLPFICYEDRFNGTVNVTDITSTSASISWEKGPGDIDHYRVVVNESVYEEKHTGSSLTYAISNLTAGTRYTVQVFPVKCRRKLNPETETFYTVPNKVTALKIINQTEQCVFLTWTRPIGEVDLYVVQTREGKAPIEIRTEEAEVCKLMPGSLHTFSVRARVNDRSQQSEESTVRAYTKPAQVSTLNISNIEHSSLELSWDKPHGDATGYRVEISWEGKNRMSYTNETVEDGGENKLSVKDLPSGTSITVSISALANYTLVGKSLTVHQVTKPEAITNLTLTSTNDTVTAVWDFARGSPRFTVRLELEGVVKQTFTKINTTTVTFNSVKSSANYTVKVSSVTGEMESKPFNKSIFTLPNPPRNPELSGRSKKHLTFTWTRPINTNKAEYLVTLNSSFWNHSCEVTVEVETHTFNNLKSGTNYTFKVKTMADGQESGAVGLIADTESAEKEIILSMVCSSQTSLHCEDKDTRRNAFEKLHSHFDRLLGHHVFWKLEQRELEDNL